MLFKLIFFRLTPNVSFVFLYKKLPVPKLSFMATQFLELLIAKIYGTKTNNCSFFFGSRTWVHKKTSRSSSCIPSFNRNYNELKIKITVKI